LAVDEPRPITTPGTRRIYSNSGYEILGEVLADRSGLPLEEYVTEGVLRPLGMAGTTFGPPSAARSGETGANPPGPAAAGLCGTLTDLLVLAGEWWSPSLISPETRNRAVTTAYAGLAGVLPGFGRFDPCDWGLGVEVKGAKAPHWSGPATSATTFGHFGRSGAFVWIDPDVGVACAGLSDRPFGPWALEAWPRLSEAVLTELAVDRTTPPSSGPDLQV
jgi:CubicO group peptidase (beta-lactamase class C family)